jgi:hypothetical protein
MILELPVNAIHKDLASDDAAVREIPGPISEPVNDPDLIAFITIFPLFFFLTSDLRSPTSIFYPPFS